jgi:type VI secretion system secreted protein Hcp
MKTMNRLFLSAAAAFALLASISTQAAVDMFLDMGKDIPGESTDKAHPNTVDVLAWSWGMSNSGTTHLGGGAGAGKASFQDLSLTKYVDKASPNLMLYCANGKHFATATLIVRKAGAVPVEYIKITMSEVMVTSVSTGGSGGEDRLTENISLNFAKVDFSYVPVDPKGGTGTAIEMKWDIAANIAQ